MNVIKDYEFFPNGYETGVDGSIPVVVWLDEESTLFLDLCSNMSFEQALAYTIMYFPQSKED